MKKSLLLLIYICSLCPVIGCGTAVLTPPPPPASPSAVPFISQPLRPDAVVPGGADFTLTVNGTGFVSGAQVNWNGNARTTTFVNESKLTASVKSSDIASAGTASVTVVNPAPGGGKSNAALLEVTNPNGTSFTAAPALPAGISPGAMATGDFTGDGKVDLAVVDRGSDSVSVFLGKGDGTFEPAVNYSVGSVPAAVTVGDFNHDGKLDLAVSNGSGTVSVLLGNGDGTFQPAVSYGVASSPQGIAVGDFNGDGKLDVVVTNSGSNTVSVLLGNGDGTFQRAVDYGVGSDPISVAVGDFNGDGKLDLVVGDSVGPNANLSVLLGNGDGTFQTPVNHAIGITPFSVAVGDINGDGNLDVAMAGRDCKTGCPILQVLFGNGDGTFQPVSSFDNPTQNVANFVTLGDINGDGNLDAVVAYNTPNISVFLGTGTGSFGARMDKNMGSGYVGAVAIGDFNGDGKLDMAVTSGAGVTILLHQ